MAETDPQPSAQAAPPRWRPGRGARRIGAAGVAALAIGLVWAERIDIAHRLIDRQIQQLKLSARYRIDEIGAGREVLSDISLGDPANPDLFVRTLEIDTGWTGGLPAITGLKMTGARLRGTSRASHLSFGSLDAVLFAPTRLRFRLPDIALTLRDSVASIAGDHGPIGVAISGAGNLRNGFAGIAAVVAPALRINGCVGQALGFHGPIAVHAEQTRIIGAWHMARLVCAQPALAVQAPAGQLDLRLASTFDGGSAHLALATGAAKLGGMGAARLTASGDAGMGKAVLAGNFSISGDAIEGSSFGAAQLGIAGRLRATISDGSWQGNGTLAGRGLAPDAPTLAMLKRAGDASAGTMAAPLLAALRRGIVRESPESRLSGSWTLQRSASGTRLTVPEVHIDGGHTAHWLSASQVAVQQAGSLAVSANFAVSGRDFPQLRGIVRPRDDGSGLAMLAMPTWTAGTTSLALPMLAVHWNRDGAVGFNGRAVLSGPLPGGYVNALRMQLQGNWSAGGGLRVGDRCTAVAFAALAVGGLELGPVNALSICPGGPAGAMVALNRRALRLSARTAGASLVGRMAGSALRVTTGAAGVTWPGALSIRNIDVAAKDAAPAVGSQAPQLHLAQLTARLGAQVAGQFSGGDITLAAMPAAVRGASGSFRWADGRLAVDGAEFRIEDPAAHPNFAPIIAHDVTLAVTNGVITGAASLRAAAANRELGAVTAVHDLASSTGHAEFIMPGLVFDQALQPKQLSALTEGIIADAKGTLTGQGRFDWDHGHVTSSGTLATAGFDFAAAFGPVKGVAGEIAFTDLLRLVTAPDQKLAIATINPGIEVDDGILTFALQPGHVLAVTGAKWPFLDGQLTLLPTRLVLGATEVRRYKLHVDGLNAAKFLARMDLSNLAATGTFDGDLPLVFDDSGGRIEKGLLLSRAPGGTVSYVGALTYKDLSPMANYAFQALRALKYRQMRIAMDGALAGDIVTHVSMLGVGQGQGAKRNFITNQIARLPIRFDVTVTAPFMQLVTSFRSLYDPAMVADPRALGLIDAQGRPIAHPGPDRLPAAKTPPAIQP